MTSNAQIAKITDLDFLNIRIYCFYIMKKYIFLFLSILLLALGCVNSSIDSRDPIPGVAWDYKNPDYVVTQAYNSLHVMDVKKNSFITKNIFKGYFVSYAQVDNLFFCNDAGSIGEAPSSIFVIDAREGKCTKTINLPPGVEYLYSFNNKIYISHGIMYNDGSHDFSIFDPVTGSVDTVTANGQLQSHFGFIAIEEQLYGLLRNTVTKVMSLYNFDEKIYKNFDIPIQYIESNSVYGLVYSNNKLIISIYLPLQGKTHILKYSWGTSATEEKDYFINDQLAVLCHYNGYLIAISYKDIPKTALLILEENGDGYTVKYKSEPGSFIYEYQFKGNIIYVFDSMGMNTYDTFDLSDINAVEQVKEIPIPDPGRKK